MIEFLRWDSDFFEARIGKIEINDQIEIEELIEEKKKNNFDRVYLFSNKRIDNYDLFLVDEKTTFNKKVSKQLKLTKYTNEYSGGINRDLIDLSLLSGNKSRFKLDPFFSDRFKDLYYNWLKNSLNKSFADAVFVSEIKNKIVGFVTLKNTKGVGDIGLIAVNKEYQGMGIGKDLLQATENWYLKNNIEYCEVTTQMDNVGARKFYESFGYCLGKIKYIYHI